MNRSIDQVLAGAVCQLVALFVAFVDDDEVLVVAAESSLLVLILTVLVGMLVKDFQFVEEGLETTAFFKGAASVIFAQNFIWNLCFGFMQLQNAYFGINWSILNFWVILSFAWALFYLLLFFSICLFFCHHEELIILSYGVSIFNLKAKVNRLHRFSQTGWLL